MSCTRREFLALASAATATAATLAGCNNNQQPSDPQTPSDPSQDPQVDVNEFKDLALNAGSWKYDEDHDVYYQLGLTYCKSPATKTYESLAIFVPGAYFNAEKNGSSYTCTVNSKAVCGNFTPATAPILMPINTGTLSAQTSPTVYGYEGLAPYLEAGCIYVYAGFRGRSAGYDTASGSDKLFAGGAPWPVVDLKAAVRYLRYNAGALPCDASRVFVFGFSAGGGVSAVLGSSGDSELYTPYLQSIGAITHDAQGKAISDAVYGSASWCPATSFDVADAAYEWGQGQYADTNTRAEGTWTRAFSQGLAAAYAEWVNQMDLRGADDAQLTLGESDTNVYAEGSYAEALLSNVNEAATHFVQNTAFPYTYTPQHLAEPSFPGDPNLAATRASEAAAGAAAPAGTAPAEDTGTDATDGGAAASGEKTTDTDAATDAGTAADAADGTATATDTAADDAASTTAATPTYTGVEQVQSTIFDSATSYFAALNGTDSWISYDQRAQSVSVASLKDFSQRLCPAEQPVSPYDQPDRSSRTNQLFGIGEESTLHFDALASQLTRDNMDAWADLEGWKLSYATSWVSDLQKTDSLGTSMETRVNMMNPLFWLSGGYEGYGQAGVAAHWRINEGLFDTDLPLCCASNLVFALRKFDGVQDVAYTPVWGQGHVLAERSGSATANLVAWVVSCCS